MWKKVRWLIVIATIIVAIIVFVAIWSDNIEILFICAILMILIVILYIYLEKIQNKNLKRKTKKKD